MDLGPGDLSPRLPDPGSGPQPSPDMGRPVRSSPEQTPLTPGVFGAGRGLEEREPPLPTPPAWRGTLPEALLESERTSPGNAAFVSAGWEKQASVRVESAAHLAALMKAVAPPAGGTSVYGVRQDGTIHNTVTGRDEYLRVQAQPGVHEPRLQAAVDQHFARHPGAPSLPATRGTNLLREESPGTRGGTERTVETPSTTRSRASDPREVQGPDGPVVKNEAQLQAYRDALRQDPTLTPERLARDQENALLCSATYLPADRQQQALPPYLTPATADASRHHPGVVFDDPKTGFHADLYRDTRDGTYRLVFRGTEEAKDWTKGNIPQALVAGAPQYAQAMDLARALRQLPEYRTALTEIAGHSLGGGLASAAAMVTDLPATTFNAAGLNHSTVGKDWDAAKARRLIANYRVDGEILTGVQELHLASSPEAMALAAVLPDAVGRQITLRPFEWNGKPESRFEGLNPLHAVELHHMSSVLPSLFVSDQFRR